MIKYENKRGEYNMKKRIDPIDLAIGRELHDIRKQRGYTLLEVAERLGCTKSLISHYEHGKASISVQQLMRICTIYEVPYLDILEKVKGMIYR